MKVPTTHDHPDGVAAGIVTGLARLLDEHAIDPATIAFIAHSTTQATNALLEGDLATVGIVRIGGAFARWSMRFAPIPLGNAGRFAPRFYDLARANGDPAALVKTLAADGVEAVAASAAFAVDRPEPEDRIVAAARRAGLAATSGGEVSTMYGLRARTRTAAINAAILPRMLRTSRVTKRAVEASRIPAPLMIMRSDGGVMDVNEVERRPILTLLSGPAAGIAGALFAENVTDGIFIEIGGTSADCSVIKHGQPQMRPARIGGYRTLLRTLDVRTLAIAGGSLVRIEQGRVVDVGPRSAHIAGMRYAAFSPLALIAASAVERAGIAALIAADGTRIALTPTCAANALDVIPDGAFARGDAAAARLAFDRVAQTLGTTAERLATDVLDRASEKLRSAIDELSADYGLVRAHTSIVGGGGAAAALVPFAARKLGYAFRLAQNAEVISPLGVALALVRDVVERTIVDPAPADLARIRHEAIDAAIAAGAAPDGVEVTLDIDRTRNRVRAIASGATALVEGAGSHAAVAEEERRSIAARFLGAEPAGPPLIAGSFALYTAAADSRGNPTVCIIDGRGVLRAIVPDAHAIACTASELAACLTTAFERYTRFGDIGRALPDVRIAYGARIADFSGVADVDQAVGLAREEISGCDPGAVVAVIAAPRRA